MSHVRSLLADRPDDWLEHLTSAYAIKASRDGDLVSLKYDQIESPMHEPIVQECRGLVVCARRRRVLAHPYNKFWNHGDVPAAEIDWASARVFEKLDGSLMILFYDDEADDWCVASSGTPRAGGSYGTADYTYADAFWRTFDSLGMRKPARRDACFMLELCAADNRIVVRYEKPRIVLHGARNMETGVELAHPDLCGIGEDLNWEVVRAYPITSIDDALTAASALDPLATEGFVVVDSAFNRVKIKSPRYVILHHMKGEATVRRAIELWQTGETKELLGYFPEMEPQITPVHAALDYAAYGALLDCARNKTAPTRKEFALAVKDAPWSATTFKLYMSPEQTLDAAKSITRGLSLAALERLVEQVSP